MSVPTDSSEEQTEPGMCQSSARDCTGRVFFVSLGIMLVGSIYPLLFADGQGRADHALALCVVWVLFLSSGYGVGRFLDGLADRPAVALGEFINEC